MRHVTSLALAIVFVFSAAATAQEPASRPAEVYTKVALGDPELRIDSWPEDLLSKPIVSGPGDAFLAPREFDRNTGEPWLVARSPAGADIVATILLPGSGDGTARSVRVTIPKASVGNAKRSDFLGAERQHVALLLRSGVPGAAWFRHRLAAIDAELGAATTRESPARSFEIDRPGDDGELAETYEFFSAGRAVAENLRLDRSLTPIEGGEATIPIETVEGIDVKAFDWKAATAGLSPVKDPLAELIPEDQHAAFFRTLAELDHTVSALEAQAAPLLAAANRRPGEGGLRALYETQLGFRLKESAYDPLSTAFVKSVAVTGSDPYFATGTDLAVLIEAAEPAIAYAALELRQKALAKSRADATLGSGEIEGAPYSSLRTADRTWSSIVARVGPAIVVTNSLAQLKRLVQASKGVVPRLASSPEYVFFRNRYAITYVAETAFVLLTDATIRRWCGPGWRIGDARRTRAAAQLADLTAENADAIVRRLVKPGPVEGAAARPGLGRLRWTAEGILSETWGTLAFLTPILETDVSVVTKAEADAYGRFREAYQRRWAEFFDPIAVRFATSDGGGAGGVLALDVTVMPVVQSSDYRDLMEIAGGVRLGANACDTHDGALVHFTMAVDAAAAAMADWRRASRGISDDPEALALTWLEGGVSIAVEKDPLFEDIDTESRLEERIFTNLDKLPLILTAEVKDPVRLALFLTGVRARVEEMGLGAVRWTKGRHGDVETMALSATEKFLFGHSSPISLRYAIVDGLLIVTVREDLLHQAIDRALERRGGKTLGQPWLGESAAIRVDRALVDLVEKLSLESWEREQREVAWRALPILEEWRRLWPDQDPVAVHEKLFKVRLVDPAGGRYVVAQDGIRIVSETYGHPTETRPGPKRPKLFDGFKDGRAGLTFENDGVRARLVIVREPR